MAFACLLSSPEEDRTVGYGVPLEEYRALYATREHPEPLPYSRYWIGRYVGERAPGRTVTLTRLGAGLGREERYTVEFWAGIWSAVWLCGRRFFPASDGHFGVV
jgi:hypothetical protein